jgi:apolipoprotein N-acyltransferase
MLALVLLVLSPTNQMRRGPDSSSLGLLQLLEIVGLYTVKFFARSFRDQPLPTIYAIVVATLFGMVVLFPLGVRLKPAISLKRVVLWVVIFWLSYFVLIAVSSIPFAYIQSAEPEPRAQIVARFVMTLSLVLSGIVVGLYVAVKAQKQRGLSARVIQLAVVLVLVAAAFYPVHAAWQVYQHAPKYQKWAYFWDMRDTDIRTAQAQGFADLQVIEIDHIIDRVGDLAPDPGYWYNICAAAYYQVNSIRADLPGWDQ